MGKSGSITVERLLAGIQNNKCAIHIARLEAVERCKIYNQLTFERLMRKQGDIVRTLHSAADDWNEAMLITLLRYLGGAANKGAMERLAPLVSYRNLMRENNSVATLEAMLLGCAGLLDIYPEDSYIARLRHEFNHLAAKYNLSAMLAGEWQLTGIYPSTHPTLRIAQLAACLHDNAISMSRITECKFRDDVRRLFASRASEYWIEHAIPNIDPTQVSRHIGSFTSDILGINFVAQLTFAYGDYTDSNELKTRAITLLENLPAEDNRYMRIWNSQDGVARNAYESQALLQLSREYCSKRRCAECPLARQLML